MRQTARLKYKQKGIAIKFTDDHLQMFREQGYTILYDALSDDACLEIGTELRKLLPPWDELKADPPEQRSDGVPFPYPSLALNRFLVNPGLMAFIKRILDNEHVHYRGGNSIVRYPGETLGTDQGWHIDNVNNSLLPPSDDKRYGQVVMWYWPEAVRADQGPFRLIPEPHGQDSSKQVMLDLPANSIALFHNYLWHTATDFTGPEGQRYSHAGIYGLADFYWEGLMNYTDKGNKKDFKELISSLTAREREYFRFPAPGHPYYTEKTLALLEEQYTGWNASGDYSL
ncbi:MAG: hypothetical protein HRT89_20970 [Lentisphaeria bacterium]|nr:hypothetical protein [Lentisphaeria bacterium]NQZ70532.1 hypothetical protein [Lentisphaeria bacterium]